MTIHFGKLVEGMNEGMLYYCSLCETTYVVFLIYKAIEKIGGPKYLC